MEMERGNNMDGPSVTEANGAGGLPAPAPGINPKNIDVMAIPAKQTPKQLTTELEKKLVNLEEDFPGARILDIKYSYSATETFASSSRGWYSAMLVLHIPDENDD